MKVYIDIRTGGTDNLTVIDLNEVIMYVMRFNEPINVISTN